MSGFSSGSPAKTLMRVYIELLWQLNFPDWNQPNLRWDAESATNTAMPQEPAALAASWTLAAKYLSNKHAFHKLPHLLPLLCMTEPRWHPTIPPREAAEPQKPAWAEQRAGWFSLIDLTRFLAVNTFTPGFVRSQSLGRFVPSVTAEHQWGLMGGASVAKRPGWCWLAEGNPTLLLLLQLFYYYCTKYGLTWTTRSRCKQIVKVTVRLKSCYFSTLRSSRKFNFHAHPVNALMKREPFNRRCRPAGGLFTAQLPPRPIDTALHNIP